MRLIPLAANAGAIVAGLALGTLLSPAESAAPAIEAASVPVQASPEEGADHVFAFRRAFIVPVADGWRTQSLVVLSLELRRPENAEPVTRAQEARLRDRLITALMTSGQQGAFADPLTGDHSGLEAVLTEAAAPVLADAAIVVAEIAKRPV